MKAYFNYGYVRLGDRTSIWDNGTDVSNWMYDGTDQLIDDYYRPAATALNWYELTVGQWDQLSVSGWDGLLISHVPVCGPGL